MFAKRSHTIRHTMPSQSAAARRNQVRKDNRILIRSVFGSAIFLSAFLLFQVQLLMAKFLLPWFGGAAAVWTTSMLFFQVLLLAGYAYAHWLTSRFRWRTQFGLHLVLLAGSLLLLGIRAFMWNS